jgi:endonuclease/exonuclease/phosphatase (EEP) superfamily protein YafD
MTKTNQVPQKSERPLIREFLRPNLTLAGMLSAGGVLACISTVAGFAARLWWPLELCCHFRLQYFIALSICSLVMMALKKKVQAIIFALFTAFNLSMIAPLYFGEKPPNRHPKTYRAVLANVNTQNCAYGKAKEFIKAAKPDIIVLLEINEEWERALQDLNKEYPYSEFRPREDNFGMAVLSKVRPKKLEPIKLSELGIPSITADLVLDSAEISIIAVHPLPPRSREYFICRNEQLEELAGLVAARKTNVIVLGDLNITSWSPYFGDLLKNAGLRDSRKGYGLQTTWPSFAVPLGITIDHCLVSSHIIINNRSIGPLIGSDHLPVIVDFSVLP